MELQDRGGAPSPVQANDNSDFHSLHLREGFDTLCVQQTCEKFAAVELAENQQHLYCLGCKGFHQH